MFAEAIMAESEIANAKIESTFLGVLNTTGFACTIIFEWGISGCAFICDAMYIEKILEIIGAESWEALPGKYARILINCGRIVGVGNIIEDKWLYDRLDIISINRESK